ncbi:fibrocystin-L-like isoform X2 [Mercenaria mercenaria]|uniref:fibrocystin-L-like isoform X2 n=1 Tax=Mercenaria mercenaria TaxID=6596 RepID=UPI00234E8D07|nr:fibrocystin-L-like isoform X2 [Mercenaria mercenaria]
MPDTVSLDGGLNSKPASDEAFTCETEGILTGNWSYQDGYVNVAIVNSENTYKDIKLDLKILKCYFPNCIKPPPKDEEPPFTERPDYSKKWDSKIWKFNTTGNLMTASESSETVNQFPAENQNVLIEEGMWVLISKYKVPALGIVTIKGGLEIDYKYTYDYEFKASVIIVLGGRFHVGWLNNPMTLPTARIILTGNRNSPMYTEIDGIPVSNKALAVYGAFEAHGLNHGTSWVRLAETAPTDTKTLTIRTDDSLNWKTGDSLIITSTSNNKEEAERVEIQSFDKDTGTITLKKKLKYRHSGGIETVNGRNIDLGAAVGILSRSISIEGEVVDGDADAWGGRIITSVTSIDGELRTGYARLHDVSLKHMGQDGFTEQSDPRFAIAYTDTGSVSAIKPSEVYRCAFADLYNSAFGAFGMDDIVFEDNVVLNALGNGVVTISENTTITHNLIANTQWTGSYDGRNEEFTLRFESALSAMGSKDLSIHDNYIAGSERIGYNVPGVDCENNAIMYSNNFGVGNVIAVGILPKDVVPFQCTRLSGFILFKNYDYGMYYHNTASLIAKDNVISDENFGLFPMVLGPDPLSHVIGNQFVKVEDSIVIGQSSVTNCTEETNPAGAYLDLSKDHRSSRGPGGERPYITIAVFTGGANNCPIKPCGQIMSYNAISGEMKIKNVTFVNFDVAKSGCKAAFAISTLKDNDDANHPVFISEAKHINVKDLFKILIHRPNVGKINPADCVDMDCDGLKKVLVKDMDGTFMGVKGSFIPQSEFEWDGDDTRRGLGDYRIPKDALTTVIGEVVSVDSLAPKGRGIVRPDACKLEKVSNGKAAYWWCPGEVDYEMMLIESYDSDRETRRLSPIAFFSGGYVDLMNGPQDHGWCNGYTCQKRISTFLAMILSGKNVSIYFSSTQPDLIRFALIRAGDDKCAVVALYYLNPNRIDVYIEDGTKHVLPTNGEIDANNNFRLKNEEGVSYIPTCSNDHGSNYIDREARLIYFVIKGGTRTIFLKRANVIVVAFGFPSVSEEDFFDSDRMIQNIAALLNIAVNKIRIVKIISESSGRRRRAAEGMTVLFEIGDGPTENIDDDIGDVTEEASQLMNECQEGNIGSALGEETNCEEIIVGQTTYIPAQPEELQFHDQISPQHEGVQFLVQPRIRAYDTNGDVIDNLGIEESPWEITASLRSCDPACGHANAVLSGTLTIPSSNGWFNFTDLQISHKGDGYIIDFEISSPTGTNLTLASSPFSVDGLPMTAGVYSMTSGDIPQDSTFSITFDLRDNSTDIAIPDITWRGHTSFDVTCDLVTSSETGTFSGTLSKTFDSATGRATFDDLTFSGYGLVTISCLVVSTPDEYEFYSFRKVFVLGSHQASIVPEASAYIVVRYNADYDLTLPTPVAAAQLEQATIEVFTIKYTGVIIRNSFLSKGSILVTFTVEGQSLNVTSTKQEICKEISSGMQITIGGTALTLDKYMTVDGTDYYATCGEREKEDDGLHPAYIALIVLLCLLVIGIVVFVVVWRLKIRPKSKTHDLKGDETNNTNRGGFYYIDNGRTVFLGAQNQKARELSNNPKGNSNFQPQVAAPITTLYDEKPGRFHFRSSPLPPKQEDGTRGITPTGM